MYEMVQLVWVFYTGWMLQDCTDQENIAQVSYKGLKQHSPVINLRLADINQGRLTEDT